jgi:hypothetical protein
MSVMWCVCACVYVCMYVCIYIIYDFLLLDFSGWLFLSCATFTSYPHEEINKSIFQGHQVRAATVCLNLQS